MLLHTDQSTGKSARPATVFAMERTEREGTASEDRHTLSLPIEEGFGVTSGPQTRTRRPPSRTPGGLRREARDRRAVALRREGHSYDAIARDIGVANRGVAYKMVRRGLERADCAAKHHYYDCEILRADLVGDAIDKMLDEQEVFPIQALSAITRFQAHLTTLLNQWPGAVTGTIDGDETGDSIGSNARNRPVDIKADLRDLRAAALRAQGEELDEIGSHLDETDLLEVEKMINRGAHAASVINASRAKSSFQVTVRAQEFDLMMRILQGGPVNREWIRALGKYTTVSRQRCKLLGILPDRKRGFSFSRDDLPPSADQEDELMSTLKIYRAWMRTRKGLAIALV